MEYFICCASVDFLEKIPNFCEINYEYGTLRLTSTKYVVRMDNGIFSSESSVKTYKKIPLNTVFRIFKEDVLNYELPEVEFLEETDERLNKIKWGFRYGKSIGTL